MCGNCLLEDLQKELVVVVDVVLGIVLEDVTGSVGGVQIKQEHRLQLIG